MEWLAKQEANFKKNRFGAMTVMLTFQSCLGSVAAMFTMQNDMWTLLSIVAVLTMTSNAMFIAQAEPKLCIITFYVSIIVNTIIGVLALLL